MNIYPHKQTDTQFSSIYNNTSLLWINRITHTTISFIMIKYTCRIT